MIYVSRKLLYQRLPVKNGTKSLREPLESGWLKIENLGIQKDNFGIDARVLKG